MKNLGGIISALKLVLKYSAYIFALVNVVKFAIEEFEKIGKDDNSSVIPAETTKE